MRILLLPALLLLAACATAPPPPPADATCPLGVPGAQVSADDTIGGIALTFTSPERTIELRERVRDAAKMYGRGEHLGKGHGGTHGHNAGHGLRVEGLPPVKASAEDIEGGAKITFMPVDMADKDALRAMIRERAERLGSTCPG